jgi:hypothetical protein
MGALLKDFVTGSALVVAGIVVGAILLVILSILGFFLHILVVLASGLFFLAFLLFSIWMVGYVYRKMKEKSAR